MLEKFQGEGGGSDNYFRVWLVFGFFVLGSLQSGQGFVSVTERQIHHLESVLTERQAAFSKLGHVSAPGERVADHQGIEGFGCGDRRSDLTVQEGQNGCQFYPAHLRILQNHRSVLFVFAAEDILDSWNALFLQVTRIHKSCHGCHALDKLSDDPLFFQEDLD